MAFRFRLMPVALAALASLGAAGCDWASTEPISMTLDFRPAHTLHADSTCTVQYAVEASGIGTAQWLSVAITRPGQPEQRYSGAETAEFWGARSIAAGSRQVSAAFDVPDAGEGTQIDITYRISAERSTSLRPDCASPGSGS